MGGGHSLSWFLFPWEGGAQCLKNRGEGDILWLGLCSSIHGCLALKSFFTFKYTSCLASTQKKEFQSVFKKF